jgi:hypothetical protein
LNARLFHPHDLAPVGEARQEVLRALPHPVPP